MVYEEELVKRCQEETLKYRSWNGRRRVIELRAHLAEVGARLDPAYKGGLIDNYIWRRTFDGLIETGQVVEQREGDHIYLDLDKRD